MIRKEKDGSLSLSKPIDGFVPVAVCGDLILLPRRGNDAQILGPSSVTIFGSRAAPISARRHGGYIYTDMNFGP